MSFETRNNEKKMWWADIVLKVKLKYLWGAFWRNRSIKWSDFPCPWSQLWHFSSELRTLSATYPLCGSALTHATDNPSEMCPLKLKRLLPVFVPLVIHNLTRAVYSPIGFHKLSWLGLKPATPRWKSQHSNHAATPTCSIMRVSYAQFSNNVS